VKRNGCLKDLNKEGWDSFEIGQEDVNWIYVAEDRDQFETIGNTVMNP
jgi:hypothetical protein